MQAEFEAKSTEKERRWLLIERRARNGGADSTQETSNSHLDLVKKGELIKSQSENLETFFKDSPMLKARFEPLPRLGPIHRFCHKIFISFASLNLQGREQFRSISN